jgi:hypothetical protein
MRCRPSCAPKLRGKDSFSRNVLVLDSRDVSKKHPLLLSFMFLQERPAFDQQRSKLDNEHDDENEHDWGSKR